MNEIIRSISLDFSRKVKTRISFASQADYNSRVFMITLLDDGREYNLPFGSLATVNVQRADGESAAYICKVQSDGRVKYTADAWALAVPGETSFSVSVYGGDNKKLTSGSFVIDISPALYMGTEINEDGDEHSVFEQMMDSLASVSLAEAERVKSENLREDREKTRISNERRRDQITDKMLAGLDGIISIQKKFIKDGISVRTTFDLLEIYPIGSIYVSVENTEPSVLFGGAWERLKDRFLLASGDVYSPNEMGGSADAVLLSHSHDLSSKDGDTVYLKTGSDASGVVLNGVTPTYMTKGADALWKAYATTQGNATDGTGLNMPPYLAVYVWKRVG